MKKIATSQWRSACGLVLFLAITGLYAGAQQNRPNIIYIYADDLGYGELGSYGQTKINTPHLDKMAAEGMRFTQHYSGAPVCAPARCMLLTGKHGGHSFIRGNYELGGFPDAEEAGQMPLPEGIFTLPRMLKEQGYTTAICGKWGLGMAGSSGSPLQHGFDYYYGYLDQKQAHNYYPSHLWENDHWDTLDNGYFSPHQQLDPAKASSDSFARFIGKTYAPDKITEKGLQFISTNRDKPFFLYLPYTIPHVALQVPEAARAAYKTLFNDQPYYGQRGYLPTEYPRATYAAMISYLDQQVGLVLNQIKALGLDENTLIFFSSDNGPSSAGGADPVFFNSAGNLRGLKMDLYEGGIREPLIVRWPGKIKAGTVSALVSAQYDLLATIAELTGYKKPINTDGISFLYELFGKKEQQQHAFLYFEYPENGGQLAIRMGAWKGIRLNLRKNPAAPWLLYHLPSDPGEQNNLAAEHPDLIKKMNAILKKEHQHPVIREWEFVDPRFSSN